MRGPWLLWLCWRVAPGARGARSIPSVGVQKGPSDSPGLLRCPFPLRHSSFKCVLRKVHVVTDWQLAEHCFQ